jgi:hypothetical protein
MPEMSFDPQNTFAVIVALEEYAMGGGWNELRTLYDGGEFVRWLRQKGVPDANIAFFAGARDRSELKALETELGFTIREADTDAIYRELTEGLPEKVAKASGPAAFYFFWSGHGLVDGKENQCLVCPEATAKLPHILDLSDIRKMFRMKGWTGFQRQMFLVSACASHYRYSFERDMIPRAFPKDDKDLDHPNAPLQFTIAAATPGRTAQAPLGGQKSRFLAVFQAAAERVPFEGIWPNQDKLEEEIKAGYAALHAGDVTQERLIPRLIRFNERTYFPRQIGESEDASEIKDEAWRLIKGLTVRDLRPLFFDTVGTLPNAVAASQWAHEMFDYLLDLPPRTKADPPRFLEFLARIAHHQRRQGINPLLEAQVKKETLEKLKTRILEEAIEFKAPYHLLIEVSYPKPGKVSYWLCDSENRFRWPKAERGEPSSPQDLCRIIHEILREPLVAPFYQNLSIEIFLSHEWLSLDADQWEHQDNNGLCLGARYKVALRWRERAQGAGAFGNIAERWHGFRKRECCSPHLTPDLKWIGSNDSHEELVIELIDDFDKACIGFEFTPILASEKQKTVLDSRLLVALREGMPFGVWPRRDDGFAAFHQELTEAIKGGNLEETPKRLQSLRRKYPSEKDHPNRFLTIFWDDPARNPFELAVPVD